MTIEKMGVPATEKKEDQDSWKTSVLEKNLDKETLVSFENFFSRIPEGLENDGVKNRLLVLGLQIKLSRNLLNTEEQKKFKNMLEQTIKVSEMSTTHGKSDYGHELFEGSFENIIIPDDFSDNININNHLRAKFIIKLRSLGFNVSNGDGRLTDKNNYYLKLEFLNNYEDDFFERYNKK